jgi:hypothetical protein
MTCAATDGARALPGAADSRQCRRSLRERTSAVYVLDSNNGVTLFFGADHLLATDLNAQAAQPVLQYRSGHLHSFDTPQPRGLAAKRGDHGEAKSLWQAVLAECPGDREALSKLKL